MRAIRFGYIDQSEGNRSTRQYRNISIIITVFTTHKLHFFGSCTVFICDIAVLFIKKNAKEQFRHIFLCLIFDYISTSVPSDAHVRACVRVVERLVYFHCGATVFDDDAAAAEDEGGEGGLGSALEAALPYIDSFLARQDIATVRNVFNVK